MKGPKMWLEFENKHPTKAGEQLAKFERN